MTQPVRIIGSYLSPYVRKVLVVLLEKGIAAARWPRTAALVARVLALPSFQTLKAFEDHTLKTPIAEVRAALAQVGAPILRETYGTSTARRGVMPV